MKGKTLSFAVGFTAAALLFGGGSALAATVLTATPSAQTFYVDGQKVALEAYAIEGRNYVQLRDIGRAVDFGVAYDGATNSVQIDSAAPYVEEVKPSATPAPTPAPAGGVITVPQSDAPFRPLAGDVVQLDDGTTFTVTEPKDEEPALPTATCDWSQFPEVELPKARTVQWDDGTVAIMNLHEIRRMQYTLYNAVATSSEVWENDGLKLSSKGNPLFRLQLEITDTSGVQVFWPWKDKQLTQVFYSLPIAQYSVSAWDIYYNGKFLYTRYSVHAA